MATVPRHDPAHEPDTVHTLPWLYPATYAAFLLIPLLLGLVFWDLFWWIMAVAVLFVLSGWDERKAWEKAGIFVFGIATIEAWVGPVPLLPGVMSMERTNEYPPQIQLPDEPERVFHGDDKLPLPTLPDGSQMVRPLRLPSGPGTKEYGEVNKFLNIQMTTKAAGTIRWRVRDFFAFWIRHSGETAEEKIEEAKRQLNDTWFSVVKEEWGNRPVGKIIDDAIAIEKLTMTKVDEAAWTRGIDIYEVTVLPPDLGHDLSNELSKVGEEYTKKEQAITRTDAETYDKREQGKAEAEAYLVREMADADADAYRVKKMKITGAQMFAADTAARVIGDKDKLIFGARGLEETIAAGTVIMNALSGDSKESRPKKADSDPETAE